MSDTKYKQAISTDIIEGATVFIFGDDENYHEMTVDEVHRPGCFSKGFTASDGCRYGLDGCYISRSSSKQVMSEDIKMGDVPRKPQFGEVWCDEHEVYWVDGLGKLNGIYTGLSARTEDCKFCFKTLHDYYKDYMSPYINVLKSHRDSLVEQNAKLVDLLKRCAKNDRKEWIVEVSAVLAKGDKA